MTWNTSWRVPYATLVTALFASFLCLLSTPAHGQIFNGNNVVAIPKGTGIITNDIYPSFVATADPPAHTGMPAGDGVTKGSTDPSSSNATASTNAPPLSSPPPVIVQPYTTMAPGGFPVSPTTPLPLPATPAVFPQNILTCSTCYGMFPTLSRCNVIANTDTFPILPNTTYQSLLPFLKCVCTFKALEAYPYCLDCFQKTQQPDQLNVLRANHLENYMDAFRQLCGITYNGNKAPDAKNSADVARIRGGMLARVIGLSTVLLLWIVLVV
ncbi:hypothetical protein EDD11_007590 [Mortierella claussenii]|nr:hypothetical protein EDD11_007590 [Mortierella claussenii]